MKNRTLPPLTALALLGALVLAMGLVTTAGARTPERPVDLVIRLAPGPGIPDTSGHAFFHSRGGERSLAVQLNATPRLGGEVVVVALGGRPIGRMELNERGDGRLYLATTEGERVPESVYDLRLTIIGPHGIIVAGGHFPPAP